VTYRKSWKEQQMLTLVVHRRMMLDMMLDTTIRKEEIVVSLQCEEQMGDISVLKLLRALQS
jgi:hypothetical protein